MRPISAELSNNCGKFPKLGAAMFVRRQAGGDRSRFGQPIDAAEIQKTDFSLFNYDE
ncbi:MAG: hypothetical protein L0220_02610 [Acidobacteria bacterium]|nr:hypothetical protein [Acidobacteriota bacterium]